MEGRVLRAFLLLTAPALDKCRPTSKEGFFYAHMRTFDIQPVSHWTEIRENGVRVATLFKTFHPTIPFEAFMKNGTAAAKRVLTIKEATDFILQNSNAPNQ